jgi:GDPmannose 4,6-dehydratase
MKKALITGVTGQEGAYLTKFLLNKGYEVHGIKRSSSVDNIIRITQLCSEHSNYKKNLFLHDGDMTDSGSIIRIVEKVRPDEIYNLAAQSHVGLSFQQPEYTANLDALGTLRLLEAIRIVGLTKKTRFYQASTSDKKHKKVVKSFQIEETLDSVNEIDYAFK